MTAHPAVSIIVPAYNEADHLEPAVRRLLAQTFSDIEIVIVDDGSTDCTAEIGAALAALDPRVRFVLLPENLGVALARQRATLESRGEYLWFVDSDDAGPDTAVELLLDEARASGSDVVICSAQYEYGGGKTRPIAAPVLAAPITGREAFRLLLEGDVTGHLWNKLFRRELVIGIAFPPAPVHSDLAVVGQLLASAARVSSIPDNLYSYVLRSGSIIRSGKRRAESLALVEAAIEKAASDLDPRILRSGTYAYFRMRFIVLSAIKDALDGDYLPAERRGLLASQRSRLTWRSILAAARRRDWRRLALASSAKVSMPIHRRILAAASERR